MKKTEARGEIGTNFKQKETYTFGRILTLNASSVKEESHRIGRLPLTIAKSVHQLLELSGSFDFEKDLVVAVGNLDIQVFVGLFLRLRVVWCICRHGLKCVRVKCSG